MKRHIESTVVGLALACVAAVVNHVLSRNLALSVYPIDADSIGIPLIESLTVSLMVWVLASATFVLLGRRWWVSWLALVLLTLAAVLSALYGLSWWNPNHWEIAASYLAVAAILGWRLAIGVKLAWAASAQN